MVQDCGEDICGLKPLPFFLVSSCHLKSLEFVWKHCTSLLLRNNTIQIKG